MRVGGFSKGTEGANAFIGLIVGGLIMTATFGVVTFYALEETEETAAVQSTDLSLRASTLASTLLSAPGSGWQALCEDAEVKSGSLSWTDGQSAQAKRFGLGSEACDVASDRGGNVNLLEFEKLLNLRDAAMQGQSTNGLVDYEEARASLGLDVAGLDFHVRSEPVLADVRDILRTGYTDPYIRPLYVGDYDQLDEEGQEIVRAVRHNAGVVEFEDHVVLYNEITNNGTVATVFEVTFEVRLEDETLYVPRHTPLVNPGASHNATVVLWKSMDWAWEYQYQGPGSIRLCTMLFDEEGNVTDGTAYGGVTFSAYSRPNPAGYPAAGAFPYTVYEAPFVLNADLLDDDGVNDAICTMYDNLPLGGYFYGESQVAGQGWAAPLYNDQNLQEVEGFDDFFEYSGELFDDDTSNDDERDSNADGHIVLSNNRKDRTLIIRHQFVGGGNGYTGPADPSIMYPTGVGYSINDPEGSVGGGSLDFSGIDMADDVARAQRFVYADDVTYLLQGQQVSAKVYYEAYRGDGTPIEVGDWELRIYDWSGTPQGPPFQLGTTDGGFKNIQFQSTGAYQARLVNNSMQTVWNLDVVNVVDPEPFGFQPGPVAGTFGPGPSVAPEAAQLAALAGQFDPFVFSPGYEHPDMVYAAGGDVFPDLKKVMNEFLPELLTNDGQATLDRYNVLVVGSNVDHQAMTSQIAKQTIRDWVFEGGLLIVFGSSEQSVQWLQPIFHASIDSAGEGVAYNDTHHPILNVPNSLDFETYDNWDRVWSYNQQSEEHFTHVLAMGENDILSISEPGEFGKGRAILTTFMPFQLGEAGADGCDPAAFSPDCQSLMLMQNLLTQSYAGLFLDYGPPIPPDEVHGSVVRVAQVDHPEMDRRIAMKVQIYVFERQAA